MILQRAEIRNCLKNYSALHVIADKYANYFRHSIFSVIFIFTGSSQELHEYMSATQYRRDYIGPLINLALGHKDYTNIVRFIK